jgi:hypothetical protein
MGWLGKPLESAPLSTPVGADERALARWNARVTSLSGPRHQLLDELIKVWDQIVETGKAIDTLAETQVDPLRSSIERQRATTRKEAERLVFTPSVTQTLASKVYSVPGMRWLKPASLDQQARGKAEEVRQQRIKISETANVALRPLLQQLAQHEERIAQHSYKLNALHLQAQLLDEQYQNAAPAPQDLQRRAPSKTSQLLLQLKQELQTKKAQLETHSQRLNMALDLQRQIADAATAEEYYRLTDRFGEIFGRNNEVHAVVADLIRVQRAIERSIAKNSRRAQTMRRQEEMQVDRIIIDGSNLCYSADQFIGLPALKALVQALHEQYPVIVLFDGNIVERLGMSEERIRAQFPSAQNIYFCADRRGADATLTSLASEPGDYLVSNDRFDEYRHDKAVVRERRLITHFIGANRIIVDLLSVDVAFA